MKKRKLHDKQHRNRQIAVNIWAGLGYFASIISYVLLAVVVFQYALRERLIVPTQNARGLSTADASFGDGLGMPASIFAYVVTAIVAVVTVIMLVIFPYILSRYYARILRRLLHLITLPVSIKNIFYAKVILAVAPLIGFMFMTAIDPFFGTTFIYCYVASVLLVVLTEALFLVQWLVLQRVKLAEKYIW